MTLRPCIAAALLACAGLAHAIPVVFTNPAYPVSTQADAGDSSDGPNADAGDGSVLPLQRSAQALGSGGDTASAVAFADAALLVATADANSILGPASASAVALFNGSFDALAGILTLSFDFDAQSSVLGAAIADNVLAITLLVDGSTLFDGIFDSSTLYSQDFFIPRAGSGFIDLSLISSADAFAGDGAFALGSVNFALDAAPLPEPSSLGLLAAGIAGISWVRLRRHPRSSR